jgi:hypothetical protein
MTEQVNKETSFYDTLLTPYRTLVESTGIRLKESIVSTSQQLLNTTQGMLDGLTEEVNKENYLYQAFLAPSMDTVRAHTVR